VLVATADEQHPIPELKVEVGRVAGASPRRPLGNHPTLAEKKLSHDRLNDLPLRCQEPGTGREPFNRMVSDADPAEDDSVCR
jgi:hypothetical protein